MELDISNRDPQEMWDFLQSNGITYSHGYITFIDGYTTYPIIYWGGKNNISRRASAMDRSASFEEFFKGYSFTKYVWI